MYLPELSIILSNIGINKPEFDRLRTSPGSEVRIPAALFELLLQIAVAQDEFNAAGYLAANPDVATAHKTGKITDVTLHYQRNGYFEGRPSGRAEVDERWYLLNNPDVADAIRKRQTQSAAQHFQASGAKEFRAPNKKYVDDVIRWAKALNRS